MLGVEIGLDSLFKNKEKNYPLGFYEGFLAKLNNIANLTGSKLSCFRDLFLKA